MGRRKHIDDILENWTYTPGNVTARRTKGRDGREVVQLRLELGLMQMEVAGRPDGMRPGGAETYFDYISAVAISEGEDFILSDEQCEEVDREFVQYYHRRICWLAMREFRRAQRDADHTLALMDFCAAHGPDEQWILSHEQYRPFVLFHRIQAVALAELEDTGAGKALVEIDRGLEQYEEIYAEYDVDEPFEDDELVRRLEDLKESIREHYEVGRTLADQLAEAIESEEYERAAKLRDEIAQRKARGESI